jgi:hypothetical protein
MDPTNTTISFRNDTRKRPADPQGSTARICKNLVKKGFGHGASITESVWQRSPSMYGSSTWFWFELTDLGRQAAEELEALGFIEKGPQ